MNALLDRVLGDLGLPRAQAGSAPLPAHPVPLPSRLSTGELAWSSIAAVLLAAGVDRAADRTRTAGRRDRRTRARCHSRGIRRLDRRPHQRCRRARCQGLPRGTSSWRLVVAQLSAWGAEHPDRAGFDSLVQAESGIALVEFPDGQTPGALPAQALDHSAGYLLAAGVCPALARQRLEGGSWQVSTSLRRVAAELLGMPRRTEPAAAAEIGPGRHVQDFTVGDHTITTVRSALPGFSFAAPRPWGADAPQW